MEHAKRLSLALPRLRLAEGTNDSKSDHGHSRGGWPRNHTARHHRESAQPKQTIKSERLNALRLLAAGVAHEIGNPLNSLHIHLQLMERSVQKLDDGKKAKLEQSIVSPVPKSTGWIPSSRNS